MHRIGAIFFVFKLLLSMPKVGGQKHDVLMFQNSVVPRPNEREMIMNVIDMEMSF
jgi:hypothetical protein